MSKPTSPAASALAISEAVQNLSMSPREATDSCLQHIEAQNNRLNAFLFKNLASVEQQLAALEARLKKKEALPLAGVPVIVKDNICTKDFPTTCASKILANFTPIYDATVVCKIKKAGGIIIGKSNMDEFAMGSSNEHSCYGAVKNPWQLDRVPGGSSGGAAACVAAQFSPVSLGSDTGGSIRQPASFCGVVGFKPSYGAVSRYGLVAFASSLDQIGPLARTVKDAALLQSVILGHDPRDATSNKGFSFDQMHPKNWRETDLRGKKLGVIRQFSLSGDAENIFAENKKQLEALGAKTIEIDLSTVEYSLPAYYVLATAQASANLARYDGVRYGVRAKNAKNIGELYRKSRAEGFGAEVKRRIMLGTFSLASGYYDAFYAKAGKVQEGIMAQLNEAWKKVDFIIAPTTPTSAFKIGEIADPITMYQNDVFTIFANLAGLPAVSVPAGFAADGLPMGLQFIGPKGSDVTLMQGAFCYEQNNNWCEHKQPKL